MSTPSEILACVTSPSRAVLTTHRNPDPDSIASICACADLLTSLGHSVILYSFDSIDQFRWIYGAENIIVSDTLVWDEYDYFWALDQGSADRHGFSAPTIPVINIDHHASNTSWGMLNYVDHKAASTCSMVLRLYTDLKIQPQETTATTLMTGLIADTQFFEYAHSPEVFEDARLLMAHGARYEHIRFQMNQQKSPAEIAFIGYAYSTLTIDVKKRVAYMYIDAEMMKPFGKEDVSYLLTSCIQSIKGTDFGVLIIERPNQTYRLRFRARTSDCDVLKIAQKIGGAGHRAAAGAQLAGITREEVIARVLDCV